MFMKSGQMIRNQISGGELCAITYEACRPYWCNWTAKLSSDHELAPNPKTNIFFRRNCT
ncbi:hypothetical protein PGT21_012988 [Puccinia graminis f. sp. tritici]|uniref:Uncharacterized protein n=1 Tax=Puccinia graminis f. sp. tritici TaxID=56615 RepID=A0A5B0R0F1_PUCGR|nr:hypothetical protein PGTUg99_010425 [Puccinia graminis f. sp. tritici]KAA1119028.1 hypothetical protein PGT21_012988 [Puccinia graminis f. sp. tritici]